jgi:hypothetical protein
MASTKSKVDYWFFYNENGSKRRGHLPKTKKGEWLFYSSIKVK